MSGARTKQNCDYLVVGAGAAGCAVAARLSEDPQVRVTLIEAGGRDRNPLFHIPGLGFLVSRDRKYNWWFETEPSAGMDGRKMIWLQGKVLGGSSSINGLIYTRGHSRHYDLWRQMGCEGWSFDDVLPYFRKSEANVRGASHWHGGTGAMPVRPANPRLPICDAFLAAFAESGFPILDDLNCDCIDGFGYYDVNISRGRRISAATAYLLPARARGNLALLTGTQALRVVIENGRATGVEVLHRGRTEILRAECEVILCGGGIKSPHLLMLSGIGPADELARHDIPVVVDAPRVGQNLQNHPSYALQYACSAPVTAYRYFNPAVAARTGIDYLLRRQGGLGESLVMAGGFFRTDPSLELADVQVVMTGALMAKPSSNSFRIRDMLPREHGFSVTLYQGTPYSRGEIRLASADPLTPPRIFPNYLGDPRDIEVLVKAVSRARDVLRGTAIARYISREVQPGDSVTTPAELAAAIRRTIGSSYHQSGACAMGGDPATAVDPQLRVRGVERLRVADASIIPVLPTTALHAPVLMIGEKAAALISEDRRRPHRREDATATLHLERQS